MALAISTKFKNKAKSRIAKHREFEKNSNIILTKRFLAAL